MTNVYCDFKTYHNGPGSLPYDHNASFYAFPGISATLPRPPKHKVGISRLNVRVVLIMNVIT